MKKRVNLDCRNEAYGEKAGRTEQGKSCFPCVWLTDEPEEAVRLTADGACVVFVLTDKNRTAALPGIRYCVEASGEEVPTEYLEKVWQRCSGIPWHILDTPRLRVREMTVSDLDTLYEWEEKEEAARFTEPLLPDKEKERARLEAYIRHMYGFYEFGIWMVTLREAEGETAIGRAGLQMREGFDTPELGFALAPPFRGKGYAFEVCEAILLYAFETLRLPAVRAVVHRDNAKSLRLCGKLGFTVDDTAVFTEQMWTGLIRQSMPQSAAERRQHEEEKLCIGRHDGTGGR